MDRQNIRSGKIDERIQGIISHSDADRTKAGFCRLRAPAVHGCPGAGVQLRLVQGNRKRGRPRGGFPAPLQACPVKEILAAALRRPGSRSRQRRKGTSDTRDGIGLEGRTVPVGTGKPLRNSAASSIRPPGRWSLRIRSVPRPVATRRPAGSDPITVPAATPLGASSQSACPSLIGAPMISTATEGQG